MTLEEKAVYSGIVAIAIVWFWLWSVADSALGDGDRYRAGSKRLWVALCTLMPVVGGAVYLILGRNFPRPGGAGDSELPE